MFNNLRAHQGGYPNPTVAAKFAQSANDFTTLLTTTSMPSGGSITRSGQAMVYDSTGKLTYAPNNLVLYSEQFDNAWWSKINVTVTANSAVAPDGSMTADTLTANAANGEILKAANAGAGTYISSIWIKRKTGTGQIQIVSLDGARVNVSQTVTSTEWTRCYLLGTGTLSNTYIGVRLVASGDEVYLWGAQLEAVTYQTTPSTYQPTTTAAYYGPRFDYDPSTLAAKGLLIEGTRTNLLTYSEQFDNAAWNKSTGVSVTANSVLSPDGTTSADTITWASSGPYAGISSQNISISANTNSYTYSTYVKAGTIDQVFFKLSFLNGTSIGADLRVSLATMSVQGTPSVDSYSIINVGNGWYRITITKANNGTNNVVFTSVLQGPAAGTSTGNCYLWGAQLEQANFPSSYIPTVASSVARAAETFSITGYTNRLLEAYYIDQQTNVSSSIPETVVSSGAVTISPPTFGWVTSVRTYTNAYAGSIASPSWLSFSRSGNAMMTDSTGTLTYAPANEAMYSQDFSQSWVRSGLLAFGSGSTQNTTATTDPFGLNNSALITEDTAAGRHFVYRSHTTVVGGQYITSVYAKAATRTVIALGLRNGGGTTGYCIVVNLSTGAVATTSSVGTPTGTFNNVTSIGNGWYRISLGMIADTTATFVEIGISNSTSPTYFANIPTYTGDGTSGLYIYGAQLERVTYQTQPSAYIPTTTAAVYGPRYDYDASTVPATPRGLLIEESRSNLLTFSEQFDNAAWAATRTSVSADAAVAPSGTSTADKLVESTANGTHFLSLNSGVVVSATTSYAYSVYLKAAGRTFAIVRFTAGGNAFAAEVNLSTGSISAVSGETPSSFVAQNVGNGWYRVLITGTSGATTAGDVNVRLCSSSGVTSYTGDGTSGLFVWGAQLEAGSFATSYIPTTSTGGITRAADFAQWTSAAVTSYLNTSVGTFAAQFSKYTTASRGGIACVGDAVSGGSGNGFTLDAQNNGQIRAFSEFGGAVQLSLLTLSTYAANISSRAVLAYQVNNANAAANGTLGTTATTVSIPTLNNVQLGAIRNTPAAASVQLNGWISSFAYYNTRLPDAILKQKSAINAPY